MFLLLLLLCCTDTFPTETPLNVTINQGVYGTLKIIQGNCMPGPGRPLNCSFVSYVNNGVIYFLDIQERKSYIATSNKDGFFEIELPNGEYYIWPDVGWNAGYISEICWLNLTNCDGREYDFIEGEFEYMDGELCRSDGDWETHSRCNALIDSSLFRIDITIDNVAW